MTHEPRNRQRSRWVPDVEPDRKSLQTLFAFAYGVQVGRMRRIGVDLQKLANQAQLATMATGAAIAIGIQDQIECIARSGGAAPQLGSRIDATVGLSGECIRTGLAQLCADTETHPFVDRLHSRSAGVRSIVYVPLFRGVQPAGVIGVFCDKAEHFTQHDLRVLTLIGREVTKLLKWEPNPNVTLPARTSITGTPVGIPVSKAAFVDVAPPESSAAAAPQPTLETEIQESKPTQALLSGVDTGQLIEEPLPAEQPGDVLAISEASHEQIYVEDEADYPASVPSFLFADEHRLPRWLTVAAIATVIVLGIAAIWYVLPYFTHGTDEGTGPMVYGPPQVTTSSADSAGQQTAAAPAQSLPEPTTPAVNSATEPSTTLNIAAPLADARPIKVPVKTGGPRTIVKAVTTQVTPGHTFVSIHLTGSAQFQAHELKNPDRIYIDLHNVEVDAELNETKLNGAGPIADFRFSRSGRNVARLVLVLDAPCTYLVSATADPYVIVFDIQPLRVKAAPPPGM